MWIRNQILTKEASKTSVKLISLFFKNYFFNIYFSKAPRPPQHQQRIFVFAISVLLLSHLVFSSASTYATELTCPKEIFQGGITIITICGDGDIIEVKGSFDTRDVYFNSTSLSGTYFGLLSANLTAKPGIKRLNITVKKSDGTKEMIGREIMVKDGNFKTQHLTVSKKWVQYSAEDLKRIKEDNRIVGALYRKATGTMLWSKPFIMPLEGRISSEFGLRRFFNGKPRAPHSGIDIAQPSGTPVSSPNDGRVALVRDMFFSGNSLFIDHGQGLYTMFFHLSEFAVSEGDMVIQGQTIAFVGATGRVTGAHLHFGVRHTRNKVSPWDIVNIVVP